MQGGQPVESVPWVCHGGGYNATVAPNNPRGLQAPWAQPLPRVLLTLCTSSVAFYPPLTSISLSTPLFLQRNKHCHGLLALSPEESPLLEPGPSRALPSRLHVDRTVVRWPRVEVTPCDRDSEAATPLCPIPSHLRVLHKPG